jgi:RHS repeat-associated protein
VVTFTSAGLQTSVADRFGSTTNYAWVFNADAAKNVLSTITDPASQVTSFTWRNSGNANGWKLGSLGAITAPGNRSSNFGVLVATGDLQRVNDPDGLAYARLGYDAQHRLTADTSKAGSIRNYAYAYGKTLSYVDAPSVALATNPSARPRTQVREAYSGLYSAAATGGGTSTSSVIPVPAFDIRAAINDPLGYGTYFTLSRFGSPTVVYAPLTNPAYATYDTLTGQLTRSVSPTGAVQRLSWVNDQLRQTIDSSGGTARTVNIEYETSYSLPTHVYGSVAEQLFTYDHTKAGWPLKTWRVGAPTSPPTTYAFDAYGRPTSVIDPIGHTTTYAYEATGLRNHTSVTAPNTQSTTFAHDAWGRDTLVRDPRLASWRQRYDVLNRVSWTLSPLSGDTTKFQYDSLDNVTKVTDAKGQTYTTLRNALGWVVKQIDPAGHADSAAYDSAGRVVYTKSRRQRAVTLQYDALNRVTQQTGAGGSDVVTFTYDPNHRWVAARSVAGGTLISTDTIFTDSVGRTTAEVSYRPGAYSWGVRSAYQADKPGRVSLNVLKSGAINGGPINTVSWTNFWYDSAQRLSQIRLLQGNSVFTYNDDDQPQAVTFPSGLGESRLYTSSHALSKRFYTLTAIDTVLGRWYRSDSLARLVRRGGAPGKKLQDFGYDLKGRLSTWQKKTDTGVPSCQNIDGYGYDCSSTQLHVDSTVTLQYDNVGNPADPGVVMDTANRLRTFSNYTMTYDADGNMLTRTVSGVTDTYTWNDFGQLTAVSRSGSTVATFAYDGFGRRIRKTAVGSTTDYVWDGGQLIADGGATGGATETYSYYPGSDQLHSVTLSGQTYYTSIEPGGDVNALLRGSDNAVVAQYAYSPWGEIESSTQQVTGLNSLRWKGLLWDDDTKLYYVRARYYDPKLRRFISEDPIGLGGGINMYAFANNDPVNLGDPFGTDACRRVFGPEWSQLGPDGWTQQTIATYSYECDLTSSFDPPPDWPEPPGALPDNPAERIRKGGDGRSKSDPLLNDCTKDALKDLLYHGAIDAGGMIGPARGISRLIGHQFGYVGAVADHAGFKVVDALGKSTSTLSLVAGFTDTSPEGMASTALTVATFFPVVNQVAAGLLVGWDVYKATKAIRECH